MNLEATIHDDWNPGNWLKEVSQAMEQVEKSTAENIRKDAQTLVPVDTGTLKQEIEVT
ncbi:MAG TPA: HK97 gp10 family phage protein, partial [Pricia antarctica]|nr:HK97 gp10 family phage protein [Pricia antarctica]